MLHKFIIFHISVASLRLWSMFCFQLPMWFQLISKVCMISLQQGNRRWLYQKTPAAGSAFGNLLPTSQDRLSEEQNKSPFSTLGKELTNGFLPCRVMQHVGPLKYSASKAKSTDSSVILKACAQECILTIVYALNTPAKKVFKTEKLLQARFWHTPSFPNTQEQQQSEMQKFRTGRDFWAHHFQPQSVMLHNPFCKLIKIHTISQGFLLVLQFEGSSRIWLLSFPVKMYS